MLLKNKTAQPPSQYSSYKNFFVSDYPRTILDSEDFLDLTKLFF